MPRPKSSQRYYFDADLPRIVERMKRERLTYVDLAIEYGMSLQAVKAAVRDSPYSLAIRRARKARRAEGRQNKKPAASGETTGGRDVPGRVENAPTTYSSPIGGGRASN